MKSNKKKNINLFKILGIVVAVVIVVVLGIIIFSKKLKEKDVDAGVVETKSIYDFEANYGDKKVVVVYFSSTGNTKSAAEKLANYFDCEMLEIIPDTPYTTSDLTSNAPTTRPQKEREEEALPKIKNINVNKYNLILLGYPIWYNDAPRVIYTFINTHNLKGKTVIPFCTSDNSGINPSGNNIASYAGELYEDVVFMSGERFTENTTEDDIKYFLTNLGPDIDAWR